jgi:hypothetical protein
MRTGLEIAGPEVWFRAVHLAQVGHNSAPVASYRDQTVEIALGPKETFENSNISTLRRRAPPDQLITQSTLPG